MLVAMSDGMHPQSTAVSSRRTCCTRIKPTLCSTSVFHTKADMFSDQILWNVPIEKRNVETKQILVE